MSGFQSIDVARVRQRELLDDAERRRTARAARRARRDGDREREGAAVAPGGGSATWVPQVLVRALWGRS